ncbi:cystathionine beta-lyase [Prosthecomicrobium pneumaticum]|uniref:Cystathionine beta-lyase n=1 Tax=Prosthecomicrobium pneumaticum TaxID=81895 RepID=A0A7W9FQ84_9HYPH|nr:cystathionine beta-lyase [Prosthecomicrobium pneumaticum]MBB5754872.1 cystathionine beta-lyase [Prosthecomicrobium pneumaticum]
MSSPDEGAPRRPATRLVRAGRDGDLTGPFVNPPVVHASTVLFETVEAMRPGGQRWTYGRQGTPTTAALEGAVAELEEAEGVVLCPSGLSAISTALLSVLSAGDHLLMADSVYGPARRLVDTTLARLGIRTTFYDPRIGVGIADLFEERTRAVYVESPGSYTFEMQDVPALAAVAHERGAVLVADNTWATPLFFKPLVAGADLSIQAGTKYLGGHSDVMIGTIAANARAFGKLRETHQALGLTAAPDDVYLTLRGMRTLAVRMERQMRSGLEVACWLQGRPEVARVLHPALPGDPGHALWRRDMTGASGLFGVVLNGWSDGKAAAFLEALSLFGIGYSWGGFESLAVPARLAGLRTVAPFEAGGALVRLHIGLEDPADLIEDLEAGFARVGNLS